MGNILSSSRSESRDLGIAEKKPSFRTPGSPGPITFEGFRTVPAFSLDYVCNFLKQTKFTNEKSLCELVLLSSKRLPEIPIGHYFGEGYDLALGDSLAYTDTNTPESTDHPFCGELLRVDITDEKGNPDERLLLICNLGQLVKSGSRDDPYGCETGFYLVVNVIDSSIWIVFDFNQNDLMGYSQVFGDNDGWGELSPGGDPFTAAKIANSIHESGIGGADFEIYYEEEDTIIGGPGKIRISKPDVEFLHKHLS